MTFRSGSFCVQQNYIIMITLFLISFIGSILYKASKKSEVPEIADLERVLITVPKTDSSVVHIVAKQSSEHLTHWLLLLSCAVLIALNFLLLYGKGLWSR